jgi:RecG-like helicase
MLRRLTASSHHLDAAELQSEVEKQSCTRIDCVQRGTNAVVVGRLRSVVYTPTENIPTLEAEIFDGTGSISLVWLGRRRIAGIEPGRRLTARGRVGDHNGRPAIYNPWYELQCNP